MEDCFFANYLRNRQIRRYCRPCYGTKIFNPFSIKSNVMLVSVIYLTIQGDAQSRWNLKESSMFVGIFTNNFGSSCCKKIRIFIPPCRSGITYDSITQSPMIPHKSVTKTRPLCICVLCCRCLYMGFKNRVDDSQNFLKHFILHVRRMIFYLWKQLKLLKWGEIRFEIFSFYYYEFLNFSQVLWTYINCLLWKI